jgi:NADP-dependent aldehyde dehydrogenase
VAHPLVKGVGFTGSIKGGRALYDIAAKRPEPIPVFAEMGSINPVVILPKALESKNEFWANQYAASITLGTGQFCTNPGLLIALQGPGLDTFIKNLSTELSAINNSCMLHPAIKQNFENGKATVKNIPNVLVVQEKAAEEHTNLAGSCIVKVSGETFLKNHQLKEEVFGPFSIIVECVDNDELIKVIQQLQGQLTGTIISDEHEIAHYTLVVDALHTKVGRLIHNGVPTGVEVCTSMLHGGPYPASTDSRFTAVGIHAVKRWVRPVSYQNWPNSLLPLALQNDNPLQIMRTVNNTLSKEKIING